MTRAACPRCNDAEPVRTVSCTGAPDDVRTLRIVYNCLDCDARFHIDRARKNICEHGMSYNVPCVMCGRTWESIATKTEDVCEFEI